MVARLASDAVCEETTVDAFELAEERREDLALLLCEERFDLEDLEAADERREDADAFEDRRSGSGTNCSSSE